MYIVQRTREKSWKRTFPGRKKRNIRTRRKWKKKHGESWTQRGWSGIGGAGRDRRGRSKRKHVLLRLTCNSGVLGHLVGQGVDESLLQVGEEHLVSPVHQFCGQPVLSMKSFQNINFQCKSIPLRPFNVLNVLNDHVKVTGRRLTPPSSTCREDR
jgi:hypothetical protein